MRKQQKIFVAVSATLLGLYGLAPSRAFAQNVVDFSMSSLGTTKSIPQWGVEVVDDSSDNMRQSIANMGVNNINLIATNFYVDQPLQANGQIATSDQSQINTQLSIAAMAGNKPLVMGPNVGDTDSSYLSGSGINETQWAAVMEATKSYDNSLGWTVGGAMPFNEPDYWSGQGTTQNLYDVMSILKSASNFQGVSLIGASTLDSDNAQSWYNAIAGVTNYGSTHVLGGSATSYANFFQQVAADGGNPSAPEIHELGEAIYAAEYGAQQGIWWGPALLVRGLFVQASQGKQLGYAQNLANDTAATVYRAPNGNTYAFAGGFERFGTSTPYRFVSTSGPVYFNGVGPISQYMIQVGQGGEAYADIQTSNPEPALDGNRWEIVNRATGQVLQVVGGSTASGALVNSGTNTGALSQEWNITRNQDGYYDVFNANSGLTLDVFNGSLSNNASDDQSGTGSSLDQQWSLQSAGNGYYYIVNGNSDNNLTTSTSNDFQLSSTGSSSQQWQFVLANPPVTGTLQAQYKFEGNVNDSTGAYNATAVGSPTYGTGPTGEGQAIVLNGTSSYVQLPSGVANSKDITISAWVNWNGGADWQRIFDFGTGTNSYMFLTPMSGDGTMRFSITTGGSTTEQILDTDPLTTGQWVHLAVTLSGNTGVLYVNGVATVAGQILLNPSDIDPTLNYIGKSQYSSDPLFNGMIDDFRIYNYALTQAQIANLVPTSFYTWTGGVGTQWSTATMASPKNWKLTFDSTSTDYVDGSTVQFDDTATSFTVNTATNVSPLTTTFQNNTATYTLTGAAGIAGTGTVTMSGSGIVNINNVNTYTGATTINAGTVNLNGSLAGSAITVNSGTLSESSTGTITGNVALINIGTTSLAGTNSLGAIRATGPGTLTIAGGTTSTTASSLVSVGDTPGDDAVLSVTGGILNANQTSAPSISIGSATTGAGTMTISGGTVNTASEVWVSSTTGSPGTLNVTGGTLNTGSWLAVGRGGDSGNLIVTAGNINVNGSNLTLASFAGNVGHATISGGTVTTANSVYVGEGGTGTLSLFAAGNVIANGSQGLQVGVNSGSIGTVNLNTGGTITTTSIAGGTGTSTFNFNGGTLKASATAASFMTNLGAAYVYSNGAIINDGGNNITITQPLKAPTGTGITSIALTAGGTGYVYTPQVTITGGTLATGGVPATAVANFNFSTNRVVGITITNPGNYTSTTGLTVSFTGGGSTGIVPTVGTITTAANAGGGLTKNGAGTLTLAGANTFAGTTTVNTGTLAISTSGSIASTTVSTAAGATLNASGNTNEGLNTSTALTTTGTTNLAANTAATGPAGVTLASITLGNAPTSKLSVGSSASHANRTVLITSGLTFNSATAGQLDLKDNDMIIKAAGEAGLGTVTSGGIESLIAAGRGNNGSWTSNGITSSSAAANPTLMALGVVINDTNNSGTGSLTGTTIIPGNTFDGQPVSDGDVIVKYTLAGDTNLSGSITAADYLAIDNGFQNNLTGWNNGDFNYDGVINGDDYTLIDNAFNSQGTVNYSAAGIQGGPTDMIASDTEQVAQSTTAIPEPASVGLISMTAVALLRNRRRGHQ